MRIPTATVTTVSVATLLLLVGSSHAFQTAQPFRITRQQRTIATAASSLRSPSLLRYKAANSSSTDYIAADLSSSSLQTRQELEHLMYDQDEQQQLLQQQHVEEEGSLVNAQQQLQPPNDNEEGEEEGMSNVVKARLLLLGAAALYGTNFSLVKILGETGMSVGLSSTLRFGMAALATAPWLLSVEPKDHHRRFQQLFDVNSPQFLAAMGGMEVGMWNSIGYVAQAVGLETTTASKSAFLCSLAVVIVPIIDYLNGRSLATKQVIGALLAVLGVAFLELEGAHSLSDLALTSGDLASLVQPLAFGLGFSKMERVMHKFPDEASRSTAAQLMAVFLGSSAYCAINNVFFPGTIPAMDQFVTWVTDPTILFSLFWTGVVTTAMTIYMETLALKTLSAAETTLIFSTEPLWGTAFASVVMGETLGINAAAGAVMILSGCLYSNLGLQGLLSFLPGGKKKAIETIENTTNLDLEAPFEFEEETYRLPESRLPQGPFGKFLSKSGIAGALTGIVAVVESANPTMIPQELEDFIDTLDKLP